MSDKKLHDLRVRAFLVDSMQRHELEIRMKKEIEILRKHTSFFDIRQGYFKCFGPYGTGVADKKEAVLYNTNTNEPIRFESYRKHLYAVHAVLCWSVQGFADEIK
jgi:hypothetical protein